MPTFTLHDAMDKSATCYSIGRIISENFAESNATLITLRYPSSEVISPEIASQIFAAWSYRVRRYIGQPFRHIRITDLSQHSAAGVVFYVIADLPIDICRRVCSGWFVGDVSFSVLDEEGLDKIARVIVYHPYVPGARIWGYSGGERSGKRKPSARAAFSERMDLRD